MLHIKDINPKVTNAILKILCAPLQSPIAVRSDTIFAIAPGIPTDDIVKNNAYIWNPLL